MPKRYKREFNVYKIVNDVDQNVYIGSTTTELWHRLSQHKADARKEMRSPLYDLMREYGVEHFKIVRVKRSTAETLKADEENEINAIPFNLRLNYKRRCVKDTSEHFDYDEICRVYKNVLSQNMTANIIGCSRITVQKALRSRNVEIYYPPHTDHRYKRKSA